jgi:chaperone required for assembly of F1-ATPase
MSAGGATEGKKARRLYQAVSIHPHTDGGTAVWLDEKPARTSGGTVLAFPSHGLAKAVAAELAAQGEVIDADSMPMLQLGSTTIDKVIPTRLAMQAALLAYIDTDLLCYRAVAPADLRARQAAMWDPPLSWFGERFGVTLAITDGVMPVVQPPEARAVLELYLTAMDPYHFCAVQAATAAAGSLVLGLALDEGVMDAAAVFAAAEVDELYQRALWGEDREAVICHRRLMADLVATEQFMALVRTPADRKGQGHGAA